MNDNNDNNSEEFISRKHGFSLKKRGNYLRVESVLENCSIESVKKGYVVLSINDFTISNSTTSLAINALLNMDPFNITCRCYRNLMRQVIY
jgi:hypothetical protein